MPLTGLFLQAANFSFGEFLNQLEAMDFFKFVLPFLLIFAVVYAVLTKIPVFADNKGAGVVIALAIGLLSLQFDVVPAFFQAVFPNFGIALSLLLIALILSGAFIADEQVSYKWIFFGLGFLMFIIVLIVSFANFQFIGSWWWQQYGALAVMVFIVIGGIVGIIIASNKGGGPTPSRPVP